MGIEYSKLDPQTRKLLEDVESRKPEVQSLAELKKVSQSLEGLSAYLQRQNQTTEKTSGDIADVLLDVRDALDEFTSQEAPEQPDFSKPVVGAVEDLKTALTAAIKGIEVSPKVAAPNVKVDAPKIDLSGVEKAMKEIPKALEAAIKKIPKTEFPKTDFKPLADKFDDMLAKLEDIDNGVRMKPQTPTVLKVTNVDGSPIGGSSGGAVKATDAYSYQAKSNDGTYTYWFFEDADGDWYIRRKHDTNETHTFTKGTGGYSSVFVNKNSAPLGSPTWADYGTTF